MELKCNIPKHVTIGAMPSLTGRQIKLKCGGYAIPVHGRLEARNTKDDGSNNQGNEHKSTENRHNEGGQAYMI